MDILLNIKAWAKAIGMMVIEWIRGFISFMRDVVDWFRRQINRAKQLHAVIMTEEKLKKILGENSNILTQHIENAPVVNVGLFDKKERYVEAVVDIEQDKVTALREIVSDAVDQQFKEVIGDAEIVRLT